MITTSSCFGGNTTKTKNNNTNNNINTNKFDNKEISSDNPVIDSDDNFNFVTKVSLDANGNICLDAGVDCLFTDELLKLITKLNAFSAPIFYLNKGLLQVDDSEFKINDNLSFCETACHLINMFLNGNSVIATGKTVNEHITIPLNSFSDIGKFLELFYEENIL